MKILILSNTPWSNDNSFGNTYSNLFGGIENLQIANIYCRYGIPNNDIVSKYYYIDERKILKSVITRNMETGIDFERNNIPFDNGSFNLQNSIYKIGRKNRFEFYYFFRNIIWKLGRWKTKKIINFIDNFDPDIIFQPIYYSSYLNDIVFFIKKHTGKNMIGYVSDDVYTNGYFSLSPFYWVNRLMIKPKVKKVIKSCSYLYTVSGIQKKEYKELFKVNTGILQKNAYFTQYIPYKSNFNELKFVYTGNLGDGRIDILFKIAASIEEINNSLKSSIELHVYSGTLLTKKQQKMIQKNNSFKYFGLVDCSQIKTIHDNADLLVHVESFEKKYMRKTKQSFSTKITDYLSASRCIFAVGPKGIASIDYLINNNVGLVSTNYDEIKDKIIEVKDNLDILNRYAESAYNYGQKYNSKDNVQRELLNTIKKYSNTNC